ncbi:hypothetical protein TNCT_277301 [Trichonephila clavata]|uniref:Uncharacterized protein n=1 Tax=Trichonephila clavata TaxID=2740835 RepID=A0A8X6LPA0_TRICU|nr:hypothetical protein TNCT_277301 [Trichonephila clavata]
MSSITMSIWFTHLLYQLLNISYQFSRKTLPILHHAPEPTRTPNESRVARPIGNFAFLSSEVFLFSPFPRHFSAFTTLQLLSGNSPPDWSGDSFAKIPVESRARRYFRPTIMQFSIYFSHGNHVFLLHFNKKGQTAERMLTTQMKRWSLRSQTGDQVL